MHRISPGQTKFKLEFDEDDRVTCLKGGTFAFINVDELNNLAKTSGSTNLRNDGND